MDIDVRKLSDKYEVRALDEKDAEEAYSLLVSQPQYFASIGASPSRERVIGDMRALPPGCAPEQKHYIGFFDGRLIAVMDIIAGFPDESACYIGLFAVNASDAGNGVGSRIISGVCRELKREGFGSVRLAYGVKNLPASRFWKKNLFYPRGFAVHDEYGEMIAAERRFDREGYRIVSLREAPDLENAAAEWFHSKWGVPSEAYLECMDAFLAGETEYGWYLCLCGGEIAGGLGVIENDFHDRKDLAPNICAVYTEEAHRGRGIAGMLLNTAVEELKKVGVSPVYLLTDHTGFYERYGWEFHCMAQGDGEDLPSRLYIHR